jgi:hypothetical protein
MVSVTECVREASTLRRPLAHQGLLDHGEKNKDVTTYV